MSFFESPAFVALISGVVLILVSSGQALLSYKIGRRLVDQAAEARRDEAARAETEWNRINRAAHVGEIESLVEECVRRIAQWNEWSNTGDWSQRPPMEKIVDLTMSRQRALSAARVLDQTDGLGASIRALYQMVFDMDKLYRANDGTEISRVFSEEMIPAADAVTESLASTKAR